EPHWSYEGATGPNYWGDLSPSYAACSQGKEQSPVDIPSGAPVNTSGLDIHYQPGALTISNNGHTIKADYDKGSTITLEGETYNLLQFHSHAPSEHTLAGNPTALELHFVNQAADGGLAVVGVMIKRGAANPAFDSVWAHLPAHEGEPEKITGAQVDAAA